MTWTRTDTIALASMKCQTCRGLGLCLNSQDAEVPCPCVLRAIFRACHKRFRGAVSSPKGASTVKLEHSGGRSSHMYFSRKTEEYIADFYKICKRNLPLAEWSTFNMRYLLGAELELVARRHQMSPNNLCNHFARMEAHLGRVFRETRPFALYPLDEYFSDTTRGEHVAATAIGRAA